MGEGQIIRRRDVPQLQGHGGVVAGKPKATLRSLGQILFSRTASDCFGPDAARLVILFDEGTRVLTVAAVDGPPKGLEEEDLFKAHRVKSKAIYVSAGSLLQWLNYDYKSSGNQIVDALIDEQKRSVSFVLPEGSLPPREVRKRKPKETVSSYRHAVRRKGMSRATVAESTAGA